MQHFTDRLIEDYDSPLQNHWVNLSIEPWRFNYLAKKWKCPNDPENRSILPETQWKEKLGLFLACDKTVRVNTKAEICRTSYGPYGKSYLVWLTFLDLNGTEHTMDVWISEQGKNTKNAEKCIDSRSPLCQDVYDAIIKNGKIPPEVAKLLSTIGSKTWTGSTEQKVQYKLNSWKQQTLFEAAASECSFVTLKQLDPFDNYLYRGDPGRLADYDLTIKFKNDTAITTRIDLKLLLSRVTLGEQVAHDAELLIASMLFSNEAIPERRINFECENKIEETEEFKILLSKFEQKLSEAGNCYIKIKNINTNTGKVDYEFYK